MKSQHLPVMSKKEQAIGSVYFVFQLLFLPVLLSGIYLLLGIPKDHISVNFLYFFINFMSVCVIFRNFFVKSLILAKDKWLKILLTAAAGFAFYWLCGAGIFWIFQRFFPDFTNLNDGSIAAMSEGNFLLTMLGTVFLVPLAEEMLHRGLIFGNLYRRSPLAAYLLSTMFFSAIHVVSYVGSYSPKHLLLAFIQYLPAGLILADAYRRSHSILTPIVIHTAINTMGVFALR